MWPSQTLEETIVKILASESWTVTPTTPRVDMRVFESSKELFINLRRSLKRVLPLRMSKVLLALHKVWARHLRSYAKRVRGLVVCAASEPAWHGHDGAQPPCARLMVPPVALCAALSSVA